MEITTTSAASLTKTETTNAALSPKTRSHNLNSVPSSQASTSNTHTSDGRRRSETFLTRGQQNISPLTRSSCTSTSFSNFSQALPNSSILFSNDSTAQLSDRLGSFHKTKKKPIEAEEEHLHTWSLCPVPNNHALMAVLAVLLYSITFLFFAQRHKLVLFIMTGLIAITIVILYTFGVLSLIFMMHRISQMEKEEDHILKVAEEKWWLRINSSNSGSNNTTISSSNQSEATRSQLQAIDECADNLKELQKKPVSIQSARSQQTDRFQKIFNQHSSAKYCSSKAAPPGSAISLQQSPNRNGMRKSGESTVTIAKSSMLEMKF